MPLDKRATIAEIIREFKQGQTYKHTLAKFGKQRAIKQAIAVALKTKGLSRQS
jgi:hypothetical protein